MKQYSDFNKKIKDIESIIKNKSPKDAIDIIQNKISDKNVSLNIYKKLADKSEEYKPTYYRFNINSYKIKVNKNISTAESTLNNNI